MFVNEIKMVLSLLLHPFEFSVSGKESPDRKKKLPIRLNGINETSLVHWLKNEIILSVLFFIIFILPKAIYFFAIYSLQLKCK